MNLDLSIIIPCCNSKKTIMRCLDSVPKNCGIETVIVDDCSKDNTVELIEKYISDHPDEKYVIVKNTVNQGAGKSRNKCISLCTKKYIAFLDSDDTLSSDFAASLNEPLKNSFDCVIYDAVRIKNNKTSGLVMFFSNCFTQGQINCKDALVYVRGGVMGKVYRSDIIQKNNIFFGSTKIAEDIFFTKTAVSYCTNIYYLHKALYEYIYNEQSLSNNTDNIAENEIAVTTKLISDALNERGFEKELNSIYFHHVVYGTTTDMMRIGKSIRECKENFIKANSKYSKNDPYFGRYMLLYRVIYKMYSMNMFWLVKIMLLLFKMKK